MASFKFLHAADIHLDSPLLGLSRYEGVPADEIRIATRTALDNLVETAIDEGVAFVVIAGDVYDGDWPHFGTGLFFCAAMGRLEAAGIAVYLLYGNHDAESVLTKKLPLPPNVHVFGTRKPATFTHEPTRTALHGWSYRDRETSENLAASYPAPVPHRFNIGVLHTALSGRPPHAPYAPCTVQELAAKGYDYWALGHVHDFEIVCADPPIVFSGNLQGRSIRETGGKGAVLVTVEDDRIAAPLQQVTLDAVRWARVAVDATGIETTAELQARLRTAMSQAYDEGADGRPLMVRVTVEGATSLHGELALRRDLLREDVRAIAIAISDRLWVEKVALRTAPPGSGAAGNSSVADELKDLLRHGAQDATLIAALTAELGEFFARTPPDLGDGDELLTALRRGEVGPLIEDAVASLEARLAADAA